MNDEITNYPLSWTIGRERTNPYGGAGWMK